MISDRQARSDRAFMSIALREARQAMAIGEVPVGAVLVQQGELVSTGHNQCIGSCDPSAHAEMVAIREAARCSGNYRLDGATLYVSLEPCLMCCGALLQARVQRLVYAAREPRTGAVVSIHESLRLPAVDHHIAITEGLMADESAMLLKQFFAVRR
ncbi:MAG: tRNA adenosine(34) deaminase TadA [Granulosicoccus sp.]